MLFLKIVLLVPLVSRVRKKLLFKPRLSLNPIKEIINVLIGHTHSLAVSLLISGGIIPLKQLITDLVPALPPRHPERPLPAVCSLEELHPDDSRAAQLVVGDVLGSEDAGEVGEDADVLEGAVGVDRQLVSFEVLFKDLILHLIFILRT